MRTKSIEILAALPLALAFSPTPIGRPSRPIPIIHNLVDVSASYVNRRRLSSAINMAADDDAVPLQSSASKKKRKRKDGKKFSPPSTADAVDESSSTQVEEKVDANEEIIAAATEEVKKTSVVMKVRDIRDVVSGVPESSEFEEEEYDDVDDEDDDELADDEEWEYYDVDEDGNEIILPNEEIATRKTDDSLEQLLADARNMRASDTTDGKSVSTEEESSTKDKIFDVISTIVTIDFFLVIGLLAWFLAGIFCSAVLKDDTVQIAFNMNFEKLTQPALGVLMIGSIAGSFGKKDEEEESYL